MAKVSFLYRKAVEGVEAAGKAQTEVGSLMCLFSGRAQTEVGNLMCLCFQVELQADNAKHAQFRIMPRYKVKAEGDVVCML